MANLNFNPLQLALRPLFEQARAEDADFNIEVAAKEAAGKKSFAECCDYIMGEAFEYAKANKNGNVGLAGCDSDQIVSMIKHYYDEDDIEIKKVGNATAKVAAVKAKPKAEPQKPKTPEVNEPSLFDLL